MSGPEGSPIQTNIPPWLVPITFRQGTTDRMRVNLLARRDRRDTNLNVQKYLDRERGLTESLTRGGVLLQPGLVIPKFEAAAFEVVQAHRRLSEPAPLNILVVNSGDPTHDIRLPVKLAESAGSIRFLNDEGYDPLYSQETREACHRLYRQCDFSDIALRELVAIPNSGQKDRRRFDIVLVYTGNPSHAATEQLAKYVTGSLSENGRVVISPIDTHDLGEDLRTIASTRGFNAVPYGKTVVIDSQSAHDPVYVPLKSATDTATQVWSLGPSPLSAPAEVRDRHSHGFRSWSRPTQIVTASLIAAGLGGLALVAVDATSGSNAPTSPESSNSQPSCDPNQTAVQPSQVEANTPGPNEFTFIFQPPNQPDVKVVFERKQLDISQGSTEYKSVPARVGAAEILQTGTLQVGKNTLTFCANKSSIAPNTTGNSSTASIPGVR